MKVGDLVTTLSKNFLGVIVESRVTPRRADRGKNTQCHLIYWAPRDSVSVEINPVWVMERDLLRAL